MKTLKKSDLKSMEKELPLLNKYEQANTQGGDGSGDCVYQTIAFLTGRTVSEVQQKYSSLLQTRYKWNETTATFYSGEMGVASSDLGWLMSQFMPYGSYGTRGQGNCSSTSDMGLAVIGGTHAVAITGYNPSTGIYYCYDPQTNQTKEYSADQVTAAYRIGEDDF